MYGRCKDLTGIRFGRLLAQNRAPNDKNDNVCWLCLCDCGEETIVRANALLHNKTKSCGCYSRQCLKSRTKHGLSKHPLYSVWANMLQRCYNNKSPIFADYGGRGIKVCAFWVNDPVTFIEWGIEAGWEKGLDLDRIDNDRGYYPDNCRFISHRENMWNTRIQEKRNLPVGVSKVRNRYIARITLGSFESMEEAEKVYLAALDILAKDK